jgi:poly [ADP-ribose] polymerase
MFLNEVVLGKEYHVEQNHSHLKEAPAKHDSVVAQGQTEPDPKDDAKLKFDGVDVVVPAGKPVQRSKYKESHFSQSEYLVYKESSVRIRYLLKMKFN